MFPYAVTVITDPDDHCTAPDGTTFDRYLHRTMQGVQADIDYFREAGYWHEYSEAIG